MRHSPIVAFYGRGVGDPEALNGLILQFPTHIMSIYVTEGVGGHM